MTGRRLARGAGFLVLVLAAAAGGLWAGGAFRDARTASSRTVESDLVPGTRFPAATVVGEEGGHHDLARLTGAGAVVIFLAVDCGACGLTLDHWRPAIEDGALAGVRILGVSSDPADRLAELRAKGVGFPLYRDTERIFGRRHGVTAVPFVVVIGPGGEILDRWVGHRDDVDFGRIRRLAGG